MTNKHPYADILQYLIDGGNVESIEAKQKIYGTWHKFNMGDMSHLLTGDVDYSFRIKPKTVMFNGLELPMYETSRPADNAKYYIANPMSDNFANKQQWYNDELDTMRLNRGLVFLKEEDAVAWGKAMCPRSFEHFSKHP